jgi:hypothetical protein
MHNGCGSQTIWSRGQPPAEESSRCRKFIGHLDIRWERKFPQSLHGLSTQTWMWVRLNSNWQQVDRSNGGRFRRPAINSWRSVLILGTGRQKLSFWSRLAVASCWW